MQKPDVDHIDGLSPAISIEQKTTSKNPRSTVGTVTEIYDYLRLLFARVGVPYSPATGLPIESQTVQQMVDRVLALPEGTRLYLLAPIVRGRKGEYRKELAELQKKGFQRVKVNGAVLRDRRRAQARQEVQARHRRGGGPPGGAPRHRHPAGRQLRDGAGAGGRHRHCGVCGQPLRRPLEGVSGRCGSDTLSRGSDRAGGTPTSTSASLPTPALTPQGGSTTRSATSCATRTRRTSASRSRRASPARSPASPSTRSSRGCSRSTRRPAPAPSATASAARCASRPSWWCRTTTLSLKDGAVYPWAKTGSPSVYYEQALEGLAKHFKVSMTTPWAKLPKKVQDAILYGTGRRGGGDRLPGRGGGAHLQDQQAVRGRDHQPRPPLPRDRVRLGARGALALPGLAPLRRLRRLPPEAPGAGGEDRRPAHRPGDGLLDPRRQRLVRGAAGQAHAEAERDRHAHPEGDPRAPAVPGRRGPRLPHAVARLGHAVRRREPAHPAGLADRLRPHRRALRAGRALHRPAPARQRQAAGDAQAPARHRQHRDRGGARRGRHPHRRLRGGHRPRRRHPRRPRRGPGHAAADHGRARTASPGST